MAAKQGCSHERAVFGCVQRLGRFPPVELWHCPTCKSTLSAQATQKVGRPVAAA